MTDERRAKNKPGISEKNICKFSYKVQKFNAYGWLLLQP
jgi:hypothetical protein